MDGAYSLSAFDVGILEECMEKLVQAARLEGYSKVPLQVSPEVFPMETRYTPDDALMDLLAILDNRAERERRGGELTGVLSYHMWGICRRATGYVNETYWIEKNLSADVSTKAEIRSIAYRALSHFIEKGPRLS